MWCADVLAGGGRLVAATVVALVVGKFVGILIGARLATALGVAVKPAAYSRRRVAGTGALAGIGFTMSLFIAGQALTGPDFDAAKVAIFLASVIGSPLGIAISWKRVPTDGRQALPEG